MAIDINTPKIVTLPTRKKDEPKSLALVEQHRLGKCQHIHVEVDESLAELTCMDCKERLDPIWYIAGVAKQIRGWDYELDRIKRARKQLSEKLSCKCTFCGKMTKIT